MKLSGTDGTSVILVPAAYELPDGNSADIECDWLVVDLTGTTVAGTWSTRDACLTTSEAPSIGEWLRSVASGEVPITLPDDDGELTPALTFLEPALAFSLAPSEDGLRHLRVHLTHGLAPPWLDVDDALNTWGFFLEVAMSNADILAAATSWESDLIRFPER